MPRVLTFLVLLALPAPAAAQSRVFKNPSVVLSECKTSLVQEERAATFVGRMRARGPQQRLQMRFALQMRANARRPWKRVAAPGWAEWVSSDAGVRAYIYEKRVESLSAPAQYRAVVRFRWRDALGRAIRTVRVASPVCRQPDLRPDLRPLRLDVAPAGQPGMADYSVPVRNVGRSDSGPFTLVLAVDGVDEPGQPVASLAPGERRVVTFTGRRCTPGGAGLSVRVDDASQVAERNEADNALTRACS